MRVTVRVQRLHIDAKLPTYAHSGPGGDLCADLYCVEAKQLHPREVAQFHTGIAVQLPEGYGALVEQRSGLALRGIIPVAGVIDAGYRGEILVLLANVGDAEVTIAKGDRIAQMRVVKRLEVNFELADSLTDSARSDRGFGSSGE